MPTWGGCQLFFWKFTKKKKRVHAEIQYESRMKQSRDPVEVRDRATPGLRQGVTIIGIKRREIARYLRH